MRLSLFLKELFQEFRRQKLFEKASALAYASLIALIPLIASFISIYTTFFTDYHQQLEGFFQQILPYSSERILATIEDFVSQARSLGGVALVVFLLITLRVFMIIEETINDTWGISHTRRLASRLASFTLLLFWGPILMGLTGSLFFYLRQTQSLPGAFLILGPKLLTLLGMTMLFWTVPYTQVKFPSAFLGGAVTTFLLTLGKIGFVAYLKVFKAFEGFMGSLGLLLLFFISIQLAWLFILFGNLITYTHQNRRALLEEEDLDSASFYWALSLLSLVTQSFIEGKPPWTVDSIAQRLGIPMHKVQYLVDRLSQGGVLMEGGKEGKLLLTGDPRNVTLSHIFHIVAAEVLKKGHAWEGEKKVDSPLSHLEQVLHKGLSFTLDELVKEGEKP